MNIFPYIVLIKKIIYQTFQTKQENMKKKYKITQKYNNLCKIILHIKENLEVSKKMAKVRSVC
ncbi:hypothetical protein GCM10019998_00880 [Tetragenococcus solitarius]|uniref:Uncharacterized protein n=1 Tax=Tetragenococcus solitarius TaxID=71453 RepID=A0ABN3XYT6_9ENTE